MLLVNEQQVLQSLRIGDDAFKQHALEWRFVCEVLEVLEAN